MAGTWGPGHTNIPPNWGGGMPPQQPGLWGAMQPSYGGFSGGGGWIPTPPPGLNLPGSPDFQWKETPTYTPPSAQEEQTFGQFMQGIAPSADYLKYLGMGEQALAGGGGWGAIKGFMPTPEAGLGWVGGGRRLGEAYEEAATQRLQQTGQAALKGIHQQAGARGALGSTVMGIDMADLAQRYAAERAGIGARGAELGEQAVQGRMGLLQGGLGLAAQAAQAEQTANLIATQQMAQMAQSQWGQEQGMRLGGLDIQKGYRQEPGEHAFRNWMTNLQTRGTKPPSGLDTILAFMGGMR